MTPRSPDVAHHHAALGDVMLHDVTAGAVPVVLLLHGWPRTWWEWRHVIQALADRHAVIAPDMRGLGNSTRPLTGSAKEYHVERYMRGALIHRIAPITPRLILCYIAERVLGLPKSY